MNEALKGDLALNKGLSLSPLYQLSHLLRGERSERRQPINRAEQIGLSLPILTYDQVELRVKV